MKNYSRQTFLKDIDARIGPVDARSNCSGFLHLFPYRERVSIETELWRILQAYKCARKLKFCVICCRDGEAGCFRLLWSSKFRSCIPERIFIKYELLSYMIDSNHDISPSRLIPWVLMFFCHPVIFWLYIKCLILPDFVHGFMRYPASTFNMAHWNSNAFHVESPVWWWFRTRLT